MLLMVEPTAVIVLATLLNDNKDSATTTIKEQIVFTLISLTIERMSFIYKDIKHESCLLPVKNNLSVIKPSSPSG
ncbi:hypothetical protein OkiPb01491_45110 [Escherichia coli]